MLLEDFAMSDEKKPGEGNAGAGDSGSAAKPDGKGVRSNTPENAEHQLKPSAPGETGTTPGTNWK